MFPRPATRLISALLAFVPFALVPLAFAQDADEAWKSLVMQALDAAGASDYSKSEQVFLKAVHEAERFGPTDARVGTTLNSLGLVYRAEKKFSEAESAYQRAAAILETAYGTRSIDVANINFNIATVMIDQGRPAVALPVLQRTLGIYEMLLGGTSLKTAAVLCLIGNSHRLAKNYVDAEGPLRRCADIREADGGMQNPDLAEALHGLALVYQSQGKFNLADPRFTLAEKIRENTLGIMSPVLAQTLEDHALLLKQMGRDQDAEKRSKLASAIRRTQNRPK